MWKLIHRKVAFLILTFGFTSLIALPAWAKVTSVSGTKTAVVVGGENYFEFKGFMRGTVPSRSGGTYKVPITLLFPKKADKFSGLAIMNAKCYTMQEITYVDSGSQMMTEATCGGRKLLGDRFIGGKGHVFGEIHWNKWVLDASDEMGAPIGGYTAGDIQQNMDAHQILADAVSLMKAPLVSGMPAAKKTIAIGFSGGSAILREYFLHQYATNQYPRKHEYDGFIQVAMGPLCLDMNFNTIFDQSSFTFCPEPLTQATGAGKVMAIYSESELQFISGELMRYAGPNYRYYEVAGGAHLPKDLISVNEIYPELPSAQFRQNTVRTFKSVPAMTENLLKWIQNGTLPPTSVSMGGVTPFPIETGNLCSPFAVPYDPNNLDYPNNNFCDFLGSDIIDPESGVGGGFTPVFDITSRDADGNATLGLKLPDIEVPLAECNGLEVDRDFIPDEVDLTGDRMIAVELGGYCNWFSDARINSQYTHSNYMEAVLISAAKALAKRWILPEDFLDYVLSAYNCPVGRQATYTDAQLETCHGIVN